jgi:diadenosine tetraphosphate (Ap4A) HIT family hydrolase
MRFSFLAFAALASAVLVCADTPCHCDPAQPETMKARECSLCAEAEKEPANIEFFFRRDINPRKQNRLLVMPRVHTREHHPLSELPPDLRARFWTVAIEKAKELWGPDWAVAYNGDRVRTQCHAHIHIGKLLPGVEFGDFVVVNTPAEIVVPPGQGVWVHPVDGKLHVHTGEQITETVLLR